MSRNIAILLAAGSGKRMGSNTPKQFLLLGGKTILEHTVGTFNSHPQIDEIAIVTPQEFLQQTEQLTRSYKKVRKILIGGKERSDSSMVAIANYPNDEDNLLIHDAVRPLVTAQTITACIEQLRTFQAVEVAIPTIDTIVQADPSQPFVQAVLDRMQLWNVQTPQGFRRKIIHQAYRLAQADPDFRATDDAGVVLRYCPEVPIGIVEGERTNIKITHPMDLVLAEQILASRK